MKMLSFHLLYIYICQQAYMSSVKESRVAAVIEEAVVVSANFMHSSFLCILALSSLLQVQVESYYPVENREESVKDLCECSFNCSVTPRDSCISPL